MEDFIKESIFASDFKEEFTELLNNHLKKQTYKNAANEIKVMFDEIVAVGFDEIQALELVKSLLISAAIQNKQ